MAELLQLIWSVLAGLFQSRASREAEITALRHQLNVLHRQSSKRPTFSALDRLIFVILFRIAPGVRNVLKIVEPETVVRWHRSGFRQFWRWKSRSRRGRPQIPSDVRQLIQEMSLANPLWGASRIHGELLKLGIDIGQTSVTKYMAKRRKPPSQGWRTFLRNHADGVAAMDLFVVPTLSFRLLYGLLIMRHDRRRMLLVRRDRASHCGMDRPSAHRGLRLGRHADISYPRPRWRAAFVVDHRRRSAERTQATRHLLSARTKDHAESAGANRRSASASLRIGERYRPRRRPASELSAAIRAFSASERRRRPVGPASTSIRPA